MAHINRRYIDKHWLVFIIRGAAAGLFGLYMLFGGMSSIETTVAVMSIFLLALGIVDSVSALYSSTKKRGWINSVIDALVDVVAAVTLLFFARADLVMSLIVISVYTIVSGLIDIFHGFLSTVVLAGACGCVMGVVIINAGSFELTTFLRFFGAYMLVVGITSSIYGIHNRSQEVEDHVARKEVSKTAKKSAKKTVRKKR